MTTRNNCKIAYSTVVAKFNEGHFDAYEYPSNIYEALDFQYTLRHRLVEVFPTVNLKNPTDYPTVYDICMLLFIYQANYAEFEKYTSWNDMKDMYTNDLKAYTSERLALVDPENKIHCLCGHPVCYEHLFKIEDNHRYALLGSSCITKNQGHLAENLKKAQSYTCIGCDVSHLKKRGHTVDMCGQCVTYGPKICCIKCKKHAHGLTAPLCNKCRHTYIECTIHPNVVMNALKFDKGKEKCSSCEYEIAERTIQRVRENIERRQMGTEDPIILSKIKRPSPAKICDTQKCVGCPVMIAKSTYYIRCNPCYSKHKSIHTTSKAMTLCIICKKSTGTDWKPKCTLCYKST